MQRKSSDKGRVFGVRNLNGPEKNDMNQKVAKPGPEPAMTAQEKENLLAQLSMAQTKCKSLTLYNESLNALNGKAGRTIKGLHNEIKELKQEFQNVINLQQRSSVERAELQAWNENLHGMYGDTLAKSEEFNRFYQNLLIEQNYEIYKLQHELESTKALNESWKKNATHFTGRIIFLESEVATYKNECDAYKNRVKELEDTITALTQQQVETQTLARSSQVDSLVHNDHSQHLTLRTSPVDIGCQSIFHDNDTVKYGNRVLSNRVGDPVNLLETYMSPVSPSGTSSFIGAGKKEDDVILLSPTNRQVVAPDVRKFWDGFKKDKRVLPLTDEKNQI